MPQLRDPLPVAPFVAWCNRRERQIAAAMGDVIPNTPGRAFGSPTHNTSLAELFMEIGWPHESGTRRLYRWRHETDFSGFAERRVIEDALHHAGVPFYEIYPDAPTKSVVVRMGQGRKLTDAQVIAAHKIYMREGIYGVAEAIYQRYGYTTPTRAKNALYRAFKTLGLPVHWCAGTTLHGEPCKRAAIPGSDFCNHHTYMAIAC